MGFGLIDIPEIDESLIIRTLKDVAVTIKKSENKDVEQQLAQYKGFVRVIYDKDDLLDYVTTDYLAVDTETTALNVLSAGLVGVCLYKKGFKPVYVPINHLDKNNIRLNNQLTEKDIKDAFEVCRAKIIMHNAKFDLNIITQTCGIRLPLYWDTMIGAQLRNENERAKLKMQFQKHCNPSIGQYNIGTFFSVEKYRSIDPEIFALYAAIDAFDTYCLFENQMNEYFLLPDNKDCLKLALDVEMPICELCAEMEYDGINVDTDFLERLDKYYEREIKNSESRMDKLLLPHKVEIDSYRNWVRKLSDKDKKNYPNDCDISDSIMYTSSAQMHVILNKILKLDLKDDEGTGAEILEKYNEKNKDKPWYRGKSLFCEELLVHRSLVKMYTSYTRPIYEFLTKDGKVHSSFNQLGGEDKNVKTGRFSSTKPNLQQAPANGLERMVRALYKAGDDLVEFEVEKSFDVNDCYQIETTGGFVPAKLLKENDVLVTSEGNHEIKSIRRIDGKTEISF